jgi:hypothetical protein
LRNRGRRHDSSSNYITYDALRKEKVKSQLRRYIKSIGINALLKHALVESILFTCKQIAILAIQKLSPAIDSKYFMEENFEKGKELDRYYSLEFRWAGLR